LSLSETAIAYALRQSDGLRAYVKHGQVEIDRKRSAEHLLSTMD
jgi:hypothetical protein